MTMKKLVVLIVLFITGATVSHAQFSIGLRGGLNFSSTSPQITQIGELNLETLPDNFTGWHVGGILQVSFANIFIQPELLFVSNGSHLRLRVPNQDDFFFTQNFSKIDLPVLVGVKFGPLRLGAGPVASYVLHSTSGLAESDAHRELDLRERFNDVTFGYQVGVGLDVGNIILDLKYEGSLSRLGEGVTLGETSFPFDTRPRQFILSIGLLF